MYCTVDREGTACTEAHICQGSIYWGGAGGKLLPQKFSQLQFKIEH